LTRSHHGAILEESPGQAPQRSENVRQNLGKIPCDAVIAFSGGVDSAFVLDFLKKGRKRVELAFFHHGTETSDKALDFIESNIVSTYDVRLHIGRLLSKVPKGESEEGFWREKRYNFLHSFNKPVITAHHLDDCVETWLFSAMHGKPKVISYRYKNVIRPFLLYKKEEIIAWCVKNNVKWVEDNSNKDLKYSRNRIRHNIVPEAMLVNPGLHKVILKKVKESYLLSKHNDFSKTLEST
jgi:tRNA(Ile)-lysidine synthase